MSQGTFKLKGTDSNRSNTCIPMESFYASRCETLTGQPTECKVSEPVGRRRCRGALVCNRSARVRNGLLFKRWAGWVTRIHRRARPYSCTHF